MSYMFLCEVGEGHFLQEVPPTASDSGPSLCPGIFPSDLERPLTYFPKQISSFPLETKCWPPPAPCLLWIFVPGCEHRGDGDFVCPRGRHRPGQEQSCGQIQGCSYRVPRGSHWPWMCSDPGFLRLDGALQSRSLASMLEASHTHC